MGYIAFELPKKERQKLLKSFEPKFDNVICHHITYKFGVRDDHPLPKIYQGKVVGYATNDKDVECLIVEINDKTTRPDGNTFHITLSLGPDRKPVDSNKIIAEYGWSKIDTPIDITFKPGYFK